MTKHNRATFKTFNHDTKGTDQFSSLWLQENNSMAPNLGLTDQFWVESETTK